MRLPERWRSVGLATLVALILIATLSGTNAYGDPLDDRTRQIGRQIMCPVCEGQSVADSNSGLAKDMRALIRERLAAGDSEQAIVARFVASYGEGILADPPKRGATLGVWLGPVLATLAGMGIVALVLRGWLRSGHNSPPKADRPPNPRAAEEYRRFREELGR